MPCNVGRPGPLAKGPQPVQPSRNVTKKPPGEPGGFSAVAGRPQGESSLPAACFSNLLRLLRAVVRAATAKMMAAPAVMAMALSKTRTIETREHGEAMLLAVVEALVQRLCRRGGVC